jgi:hypothetical protein
VAVVTDRDRDLARRLPDEFVKCLGTEADRVIALVEDYWPSHGTISMAHLAEALVPILKKLLEPSAEVTDRDRGICEAVVATWLGGRWFHG